MDTYFCPTSALDLIFRPSHLTFGMELPLENDGLPEGGARRIADGRPHGVPDLSRHPELARQIDASGRAAIWMRDVPVFDPGNFGDAGSIYDPFVNLDFLAGFTKNVASGAGYKALPVPSPLSIPDLGQGFIHE